MKISCSRFGIIALSFFLSTQLLSAEVATHEAAPTKDGVERAIARVYPALVQINVVSVSPSQGRMRKVQGAGSGAIISEEGFVITNHHVAGNGVRFVCRMPDGEEIPARLVGTDALSDIAIIKLDLSARASDKVLPTAQFGDSDKLKVGDVVYAMGSPAALSQSVTRGIVSNTSLIMSSFVGNMSLDGENVGSLVRWIAHDAQIFGGNSGGPLVDRNGEIIGINEIGVAGLGGAIPANLAKAVAAELIGKGKVERSWMGFSPQPLLKDMTDIEGVLVGGVIAGSPSEKAGLKPGDIITALNGEKVDARIAEDIPKFNALTLATQPGSQVELEIMRAGQADRIVIGSELRAAAQGDDLELKSWGMTARNLTRLSALEFRHPNTNGVHVVTLGPGGPANDAKPAVKSNDIIVKVDGRGIADINELVEVSLEAIGDSEERVPVLVELVREAENILTVVRIGKEPDNDPPISARKAWLPIVSQVLTRPLAEKLGLDDKGGVRITQLYPGRSAELAGLRQGDILLEIDGMPIEAFEPEDSEVLDYMVRQYKIGSEVDIKLIRDGEAMQLAVVLEEPEKPRANLESYEDDNFEFSVREISLEDRVLKQIDKDVEGVLVDQVKMAGWAALAGLKSDDILISIDGRSTSDVDTVEEILLQAEEDRSGRLVLFVRRRISTMFLELEPSWEVLAEVAEDGEEQ
jgi:serine protease Do